MSHYTIKCIFKQKPKVTLTVLIVIGLPWTQLQYVSIDKFKFSSNKNRVNLEGTVKASQQPIQYSFVFFWIVSMLQLLLEASVQNSVAHGWLTAPHPSRYNAQQCNKSLTYKYFLWNHQIKSIVHWPGKRLTPKINCYNSTKNCQFCLKF